KVQDTADATAAAVDSLTTTVTQQGNLLTSTGNRTTQLENGLATTNAAVAKKADATAVQDLTNTVKQLGNDLTAANSAITKLTGNLANTDKALAQKADATALATLDTKVTQQGKTLESQSNSLTNLSNSLSQVAADIDASGQIPGNLVVNPSFERGLDGYTGRSTATSVVEVSAPHSGTRALKVDPGSVSPGQYIPFVQGRTYEIGVWVKEPGATTDNGAGNNKLRIGNSAGQPVFERPYNSGTVGTNWSLISGRWKATETASLPVTMSNYLISGSRYFDDFYVTDVTDRVDIDATAGAVTGLTNRVNTAEGHITSQSQQLTNLQNSLNTTNAALEKKAEASAVTALTQQVEQNGQDIRSNTNNLTSLSNRLVNGLRNSWSRRIYPIQLASGVALPSFSDIRAVAPTTVDEVADTTKLDFTFAGSYLVALYSCQVKVAANTTVTMGPGSRVFDDTGVVFVNGVQVAWGNASTSTVSFELKAGWNTVEFLVNQWTGQAYINLGLKLSDKVAEMYSGLGVSALANAAGVLSSNVSQIGNDVVSNSQSITQLRNALTQTDANVASKADQTAMNSLTGRVEKTESGLTAANANITSLKSAVRAGNASGGDLIPNPTFDPTYDQMGFSVVSTTAEDVPSGCPYGYAARIASRDHHPNFAAFPATLNDVIEISALVACGAGTANFNLYVGTAVRPDTSTGAPLMAGGGKSPSATWQRTTWRFKVTQAMVDRGYIRPFLQISQNSPYGTVWFVTDWHMRNVTAAQKVQDTADATAAAVDSLTTTVTQQGNLLTSTGNRTTQLENGLATAQNDIGKKADASALQDLRNTVISQGGDLTAANSNITKLQASINRRTVFTVAARGLGSSVPHGVFDESGNNLFTPGRSWALITFAKHSDGSTVIATSKTYDVFGSANNGATMSADIEALASGTYVCVLTFDEPSGNRGKILSALESLGGTSEVVNSLPYRGAYILLGRKGMRPGDGLELRAPTGGDATAHISTSVEFVNGVMMGLGAAGGVMMKADANASAITTLQNTVKAQGGNIDSLSSSVTALENSLRSTNDTVSKKADTSAVSSLTGRVSQVEKTITSQSQSITSLTSTINTIRTQGANPWVDGTFESYGDGHVLGGGGTAVVVASQKFTGNKSLQVSRKANNNGNSDKQLGSWQSVREDAKFRFEFWAMMPADQKPSSGWTTLVGINSLNAAGQNSWQSAVTVSEAALGARDKWVKFTGIASNNGGGRTRAVVWISTRGASGSGTPGYSLYIDDLVITDVTDAKAAQDASDATASAVSGLTARVTDAEGKITAQAQQQAALATKVDNANSRVDNMAKTLSDSQNTQASLNTSLQSQIDAQAAANIKNQTTLDNTIKSVASITSTQQTHATALAALATQQTTLTSSVGDLSASVQNTAKTVADVNGTVSSLWSMKVETVNGKNVGAGITLGSNGETSDMILYADRFSLFNRNNATAVPVMVAEGNELYIDTARIKNSSLTSTKIADGSITNAKIGNEIRSNDFVDGSRGWRIAKDGSSQFNNVIVRGAVYATDGWFQGTVYANHIEGDIGSFAINIAQHRTRKVPKATWQWFELARFRRQNFDQVINIRGGLLQTDSITIDGGAKLRAGMSYAPGADGGLNPGYLSYAMLLRGTGATSGGGSMELGIELMYETGGATRLLTAQESMNVDNMSFVVPAGTGDAVLRYGCYLDRNGQMVLTILSRFDAFAARNNNVIRAASSA
ncbi:phage tail tip fiber protein, partial [Klebsiella pneumoniae]